MRTWRLTVSSSTTRTGPGTKKVYPRMAGSTHFQPACHRLERPSTDQPRVFRTRRGASRPSEEISLALRRRRLSEGLVALSVGNAATRSSANVALLNQVWLHDVFQRVARLGQFGGKGLDADRP